MAYATPNAGTNQTQSAFFRCCFLDVCSRIDQASEVKSGIAFAVAAMEISFGLVKAKNAGSE